MSVHSLMKELLLGVGYEAEGGDDACTWCEIG